MPLPHLFGDGRLVITIDPVKGKERYQGTVELHGGTIAQALESYFVRSEQLATRLWLAADEQRATGMLLQRLPGHHWQDEDTWERAAHLGSTLTRRELLGLPTGEILHRLYHEDDIRLFARKPVSFRCTCSRERVEAVLRMLGQEEIESIVREQGNVRVDCEFCASHYEFDTVDATQLFTAPAPPDTPSTRQ
jgi:molecular chaperone Hsp33